MYPEQYHAKAQASQAASMSTGAGLVGSAIGANQTIAPQKSVMIEFNQQLTTLAQHFEANTTRLESMRVRLFGPMPENEKASGKDVPTGSVAAAGALLEYLTTVARRQQDIIAHLERLA